MLGGQFKPSHRWPTQVNAGLVCIDASFSGNRLRPASRTKSLCYFRRRGFTCQLRAAGVRVRCGKLDFPNNRQFTTINLEALVPPYQAQKVQLQLHDEWRLDKFWQELVRQPVFQVLAI